MKKFRGQRRYYRKLATGQSTKKQIAGWIDGLTNGSLQRDFGHIHYDCPKSFLFRWKAVKLHLDALIRDFETVAHAAKSVNTMFQLWAFVGMDKDFGADPILYIHTPNHEHNNFPQKFNNFTKTFPLKDNALSQYLEKLSQKGYSILYSQTEPQFTQIVIYRDDVGVNLYTPEDENVGADNNFAM